MTYVPHVPDQLNLISLLKFSVSASPTFQKRELVIGKSSHLRYVLDDFGGFSEFLDKSSGNLGIF